MADRPAWQLDAAGHVLLRLARLLFEAGADSEHVRQRVEAAAIGVGISAQLSIGSERLLLMVESGSVYRTRMGHALGAMGIDASRLASLELMAEALAGGRMDAHSAEARLGQIEHQKLHYPGWLLIIVMAATAASLAHLFGATWLVVGAAFIAGLVNMLLRQWLPPLGVRPAATVAVTAAISGMVAILPLHFIHVDPSFALAAAGMILVPGVPLINGVRDLVEGHSAIGLARLANAIVVVLSIVCGLAMASQIWALRFPVTVPVGSLALPWDFLFASIAAFGFAILFNAPRNAIAGIMLCGALAHAARTAMLGEGGNIVFATLIGAIVAALIAMLFARRLAVPWTVFAFPGVVSMIPGSYAFRGMIGALEIMKAGASSSPALLGATIGALVSAAVLTVAIGLGLMVSASLQRLEVHLSRSWCRR